MTELEQRFLECQDEILYRFLLNFPMDLTGRDRMRLLWALAAAFTALEETPDA